MIKETQKWLGKNRVAYSVSADGLIYVDGDINIAEKEEVELDGMAEVSGSVDVSENATFTAPALVTIGEVKYNSVWFGHAIKVYDEMGCVVVSEKERDGTTILYCRKASFKDGDLVGDKYFVVSQGQHNAHGESLDAAMADLMFKTADRDVSKYRNMPADTVKSPHEWATVYRTITGACQYSTQQFVKDKGALKESYTLAEIIEQTRGAYGSEKFRETVGAN